MTPWLSLLGGLGLLYIGAQTLIKGGTGLALRLGLTPLVIGLTVIAYGTSSPEMVVSLQAVLSGNGGISIGNVVGSNICNIALILGLCSLVTPVTASSQIIRREIPIMIAATVVLCAFLIDESLARWEGAVLFLGAIVYTVTTVRAARKETAEIRTAASEFKSEIAQGEESAVKPPSLITAIGLTLLGLAVLVAGSHFFVGGAVTLAQGWGISQTVIGLTIVAVGTSMPELATSLVAAVRKHSDVAIGNIVGSNIFNIVGILGLCALVHPISAPGISLVDLGLMLAIAVALLPLCKSGGKISRIEAGVLLVVYVGYTWWLIANNAG
jgi:cation:H+ antiporter